MHISQFSYRIDFENMFMGLEICKYSIDNGVFRSIGSS